jgi:hypothetical protein
MSPLWSWKSRGVMRRQGKECQSLNFYFLGKNKKMNSIVTKYLRLDNSKVPRHPSFLLKIKIKQPYPHLSLFLSL